jgi:hypothetical protein
MLITPSMDAALTVLAREDPDVLYILLAAVDDAGHAFGSAFDLDEWDDRGTPHDVSDDVSKFNPHASRQGILNVVREADVQFGRFLDALERRGGLDHAIIVVESDHAMVTHHRRALDLHGYLQTACRRSLTKDYFAGGASGIGIVAARRDDPAIIRDVEAALENWELKDPVTGEKGCPVVVYNREEMKTGVDTRTGKAGLLPREYYSGYYVEHRKPGDQVWADLLVLASPNYEFRLAGIGLGNLGAADLPFTLPQVGYFIGGHGSFDTRDALLMVSVPGKPAGINEKTVYAMDVAPTIYRLLGWPLPECVDGKGLPGLDPESVTVTVEGDALTISGETPGRLENVSYLFCEQFHGKFSRTLKLNVPVDADRIEATFDKGVLTLVLPKPVAIKPMHNKVKTKKPRAFRVT